MKKPTRPNFKPKKFLHLRKFLNKDEGMAAIEANVTVDYNDIEAHLDISDCNRKVSLAFWSINKKDATKKLEKLDLLIDSLNKFKEAYILAIEEHTTRDTTYEEYRKAYKAYEKKHPNKNKGLLEAIIND